MGQTLASGVTDVATAGIGFGLGLGSGFASSARSLGVPLSHLLSRGRSLPPIMPPADAQSEACSAISRQEVLDRINALERERVFSCEHMFVDEQNVEELKELNDSEDYHR